jgi:hypothetical protein
MPSFFGHFIIVISVFIVCVVSSNSGETCNSNQNSNQNTNQNSNKNSEPSSCSGTTVENKEIRFTQSWNEYLTAYEKAQENFKTTACQTEEKSSSKLHCEYKRVIQQEIANYAQIT